MFTAKRFLIYTALFLTVLFLFHSRKTQAAPATMPDGTLFDAQFYAQRYLDVVEYYGTTDPEVMYRHYQEFGRNEGRLPYADAVVQTSVQTADSNSQPAAGQPAAQQTTTQPSAAQQSTTAPQTTAAEKAAPAPSVEQIPARPLVNPTPVTLTAAEEEKLRTYFQRAVFVGDSIMAGYRNYLTGHRDSVVSGALFLASTSYSAYHALHQECSLHPAFRGKKQPVWQNIAVMDVDRVFILFGTNDLGVLNPAKTTENIFTLVDRIHAAKPGVEVHLISMTPVRTGAKNRGALNNAGVEELNAALQAGLAEHGVAGYVEICPYLQDENGGLRAGYCSDHYVHQTTSAYGNVWDVVLTAYAKSHS